MTETEISDDDLIEQLLDEALLPYQGKLTPQALVALREELGDELAALPSGRRLLRQLRADIVISRSGDVVAPGATAEATSVEEAAGGGKRSS